MPNAPKPIFIVGCPRSGNTLLGCLLNKHPELFIIFEKKLFSGLRRKWRAMSDEEGVASIRSFVRQANEFIRQQEVDLSVSFEEFEAQQGKRPVDFGNLLDTYMQILMCRFKASATVWGDKSPRHTAYLSTVKNTYPQARFVFIYRDPRHTVNSLSKPSFPYASDDPVICAEVVRQYFQVYREQKKKVSSECVLEVQYERLVQNPERSLQRICEFLEVTFTDRLLEPADRRTRQLFGWPSSKAWGRVVPQSSSTPPEDNGYVEPYLAEWIETFGYDRQKQRFELGKKLTAECYLSPFKSAKNILNIAFQFRYSNEEIYLPQKWPKAGDIKKWFNKKE